MPLSRTLWLFAAKTKLPFIFLLSPPLRQTSSLFDAHNTPHLSPSLIAKQLRDVATPVDLREKGRSRLSAARGKEFKKRGFNAVIHWCAYHQERYTNGSSHTFVEVKELDTAVLQWVRSNASDFTCGQCLVLLSFLCDVLWNHCSKDVAKLTDKLSSEFEEELLHMIAQLLAQATGSEQLELQPLFILLTAAYGLYRVTQINSSNTAPAVFQSTTGLSALWAALLHQFRLFAALPSGAQTKIGTSVTVEAILTLLLLLHPATLHKMSLHVDYHALMTVLKLLELLILPAVQRSREDRQKKRDLALVDEGSDPFLSDVVAHGDAEQAGRGEIEAVDGGRSLLKSSDSATPALQIPIAQRVPKMSTLTDMRDYQRILETVTGILWSSRHILIEYLLCVVREPAEFTVDELRVIPNLFAALRSLQRCRESRVADYILEVSQTTDIEILVSFMPFVITQLSLKKRLRKLLVSKLQGQIVSPEDDVFMFSPEAALTLFSAFVNELPYDFSRYLLLNSLRPMPGLLAAVKSAAAKDTSSEAFQCQVRALQSEPVALSYRLCVLFRTLCQFYSSADSSETDTAPMTARECQSVVWLLASAVDWKNVNAQSLQAPEGEAALVRPSILARVALHVYRSARLTYCCLSEKQVVEDRMLLNIMVVPILKDLAWTHQRQISIVALCRTLSLLQSTAYQRQLLLRILPLTLDGGSVTFYLFVGLVAPWATQLKVSKEDQTKVLLTRRVLAPALTWGHLLDSTNAPKRETVALTRTVRYLLAIGALEDLNGANKDARRESVRSWFERYFSTLASLDRDVVNSRSVVDKGRAPATVESVDGEEEAEVDSRADRPGEGGEQGESVRERNVQEADMEEDDTVDQEVHEDGVFGDAFKGLVTDADVEEVVSLLLQVGCKVSHRVLSVVARRFALALEESAAVPSTVFPNTEIEGAASVSGIGPSSDALWLDPPKRSTVIHVEDGEETRYSSGLVPLLPAHFVCAVRADSTIPLPLSDTYLRELLFQCDLRIFHHVVSAFFELLKRRASQSVVLCYLRTAETVFEVLQLRVAAVREEDRPDTSAVVLRSFRCVLNRFFLNVPSTDMSKLLHCIHPRCTPGEEGLSFERGAQVAHAAVQLGNISSDDKEQPDIEEEAKDDEPASEMVQDVHTKLEAAALLLVPCLAATEAKELGLTHLRRLSALFPSVAQALFIQLQPQLSCFSQRELLKLVSQYPAGANEVLKQLARADMRISVDLNDYTSFAKHLPMTISKALVEAHLPHLSLSWIIRILSALSTRHEDVPLSLLGSLLNRVESLSDEASESDKSLLLLILQSYLLFRSTPLMPQEEVHTGGRAYDSAGGIVNDSLLEDVLSPRTEVLAVEQHERRELIRSCCDRLLSLDHISTLEALRFFLLSYPPSLHRMRERGVVAKVEQCLLPELLGTQPVQWRKLAALTQLLAEHQALLPSTVTIIANAVFTEVALAQLYEAALASRDSDVVAALESLLRMAMRCAHVLAPTHAPFPLLDMAERVLRVFDAPQHWLSALTRLLSSTNEDQSATEAAPTVERHLTKLLLAQAGELSPSEFARLLQGVGRLRAWDLLLEDPVLKGADDAVTAKAASTRFDALFASCFTHADAHSRCVMLKAIASDAAVLRNYESLIFPVIQGDVPLLSPEDLELILTAALQVTDELIVEPLLDAIGSRLMPLMDQCRRSALVRLLQCHTQFRIDDVSVVSAAVSALERQSSFEVKMEVPQVITVLQSLLHLTVPVLPERFMAMCFQRLEKTMHAFTPFHFYQVGRLILDLEMGYSSSVSALVLAILESRDGPRAHKKFQSMAEELCDVFEVEIPSALRASRLRKSRNKQRSRDFWAAQRRVKREALLHK